jgi:hypothetical protein
MEKCEKRNGEIGFYPETRMAPLVLFVLIS